jgi:hypothetical protein
MSGRPTGGTIGVAHWRDRLPASKRRIYDRSDAVRSIPLRPTPALRQAVSDLEAMLPGGDRTRVTGLSQRIADGVCAYLGVRPLRVVVQGRRPSSKRGELHGLYTPGERREGDTVKLWMMTAKRGQVVAFRTFLRTLVHELCHHLDYTLLALRDSLHTDGFYVRESALLQRLAGEAGARPGTRGPRRPPVGQIVPEPVPAGGAARSIADGPR